MINPQKHKNQPSEMSKFVFARQKASSFISDGVTFLAGSLIALLLVWALWSFTAPPRSISTPFIQPDPTTRPENPTTFYDDPELSYLIGKPIKNWNEKRQQYLTRHPTGSGGSGERVLIITGSQPNPCKSPTGDHLQLRLFKNKVDYCRIHGYDIFYNNVLLDPKMYGFWAKYAALRAAMIAHPESEWIWWVDSDAVITDMDFDLPLQKYKNHNMVIHGWAKEIYEKRSWTGLNAGVFLLRNCQWSLNLLERWAEFGPQSPDFEKWGLIEKQMFPDKMFLGSDDQTAIAYLLLEEKHKWGDKIFLENDYFLQGYWVEIVGLLDKIMIRYKDIETKMRKLRRRHAEKGGEVFRAEWEEYLKAAEIGEFFGGRWRRPLITHFTGCEPCSGDHNDMYTWEQCWDGIVKALNFADDQVLSNFGYFRPDLMNTSYVEPIKLRV